MQHVIQILENDRSMSLEMNKFLNVIDTDDFISSNYSFNTISILKPLADPLNDVLQSAGSNFIELCLILPRNVMKDLHEDPIWDQNNSIGSEDLLPQLVSKINFALLA